MINANLRDIVDLIENKWYEKKTIVVVLIVVLFLLLTLFSIVDLSKVTQTQLLIIIISLVFIFLIWLYSRRIPKVPKNKVGFIVSVKTNDEEVQKILKSDFIDTLQNLINNSKHSYAFHFIEYPKRLAGKINTKEEAHHYLSKSKGHYMIYGRAAVRFIDGKNHHVLNFAGVIKHRPMPLEISRNLSKEFTELLPQRVFFATENDIFSFEFTSKYIILVSKYVIGIASYLSGDVEYAQSLLEDVYKSLKSGKLNLPAIIKIKQRIPDRLVDIYLTQAAILFKRWDKHHHCKLIEEAIPFLEKIEKIRPNDYQFLLLNAIRYFVIDRNLAVAIREIRKCKHENGPEWRYSLAFLQAYQGNLKQAYKQYQLAFRRTTDNKLPIEIEGFIIWMIEKEPEKVQLYFCLGLINFHTKGDLASAYRDFRKFLEEAPKDIYENEKRIAREYLNKIESRPNQY